MKCDTCSLDKPHMRGAIINGKYGQHCLDCLGEEQRGASGQSAAAARDKDREDNAADLVQPWDAKGKANRDFARLYPDQAKEMFSESELKEL